MLKPISAGTPIARNLWCSILASVIYFCILVFSDQNLQNVEEGTVE